MHRLKGPEFQSGAVVGVGGHPIPASSAVTQSRTTRTPIVLTYSGNGACSSSPAPAKTCPFLARPAEPTPEAGAQHVSRHSAESATIQDRAIRLFRYLMHAQETRDEPVRSVD